VTPFRWSSAALSDPGKVRRINEDAFLDRPDIGLWAVADGMGGHDAGDLASSKVIASLNALPAPRYMGSTVNWLTRSLREANSQLRLEAQRRGGSVIGSTVAALLAFERHSVCLWAGDSRIYLFREGKLRQLTRDHSQVEALINMGALDPAQAENHPSGNVITRAVGGADELDIDTQIQEIHDGDTYLLCSDGLNKELSVQEIEELLGIGAPAPVARALIERARDGDARDNVTVVVMMCDLSD
jgi:protein phosphatase